MKRFAITGLAVLGLMLAASTAAEAGGVQVQIGGFGGPGFGPGPSFSNGPGFNRGPGFSANPGFHGGHNHRSGFGNVPPAIWHDTSHYDWIPGQWVRHGHHVHWVPGRWVPHQTGHIDTLHGNHVHHHAH